MARTLCWMTLFSLLVVGCEKHEDPATIIKTIDEMDARFAESVNKMDVDGVASIYWNSPDLVTYYPDTLVLRGYDAIKTYWQTTFAMSDVKKFEFTDHHVVATPHMAADWGQWTFTLQPKRAPSEMTFSGRYSQVWEQKDGKWVVTVDHASSPLPPAPQQAEKPKSMKMK